MQHKLQKAITLSLFLGKSQAVTDHANGMGGDAPCLEYYQAIWEGEALGYDPHAVMGLQASAGGYIAVGAGLESEEAETALSFVLKTKGDCTPDSAYTILTSGESDCTGLDWVTKFGTSGKHHQAMWVAESPDASYLIAVGIQEEDGFSKMHIVKLQASDGELVWEMDYDSGSGVEGVAFTSDGGFVVTGYTENPEPITELGFKSGGQLTEAAPFVGKISAADAESDTKPTSFEWTYTKVGVEAPLGSAKTLRIDSDDNVYVIYGLSTVVKLDSSGEEVWNTGVIDFV